MAFIVYNDVNNDTRVLKIADTVASAGATVRIFAFSSRSGTHDPGLEVRPSGVEILRIPLREIRHLLPLIVKRARGVLKAQKFSGSAQSTPRDETTPGNSIGADSGDTAGRGVARAKLHPLVDLWNRADLTVRLGSFWRSAAPLIVDWGPDLIHAHDANTLWPAWVAARRSGVPFIYDSHELWRHRNVRADRPFARRFEVLVERIGISKAAAVITVSPSIVEWLRRTYRLKSAPTLVRNIPPYTGSSLDLAGGRLRELAGLADHDQVLSYCGGITTNRGLEAAIDALPLLPTSCHFVVLGRGSLAYVRELQAQADGLGVLDRLHFVGPVAPEEVSQALVDADLALVLTKPMCLSYEYSLPNKLFESIQARIPIVALALPDTGEIVRRYGLGELVPVDGHPKELADSICRVLDEPVRYRAAAEVAASELTWSSEVDRLLALYRSIL